MANELPKELSKYIQDDDPPAGIYEGIITDAYIDEFERRVLVIEILGGPYDGYRYLLSGV